MFLQTHIELSQQQYYPESTVFEDTGKNSRGQPTITHESHIPIQRKRLKIMKMMVSWKRFKNRIEGDFGEESLFED